MPPKNPPPSTVAAMSYELALQELETLVQRMELGQMPLDDLLSGYSRGAQLLKHCRDKLGAVEQQIRLIDEQTHASEQSQQLVQNNSAKGSKNNIESDE